MNGIRLLVPRRATWLVALSLYVLFGAGAVVLAVYDAGDGWVYGSAGLAYGSLLTLTAPWRRAQVSSSSTTPLRQTERAERSTQ